MEEFRFSGCAASDWALWIAEELAEHHRPAAIRHVVQPSRLDHASRAGDALCSQRWELGRFHHAGPRRAIGPARQRALFGSISLLVRRAPDLPAIYRRGRVHHPQAHADAETTAVTITLSCSGRCLRMPSKGWTLEFIAIKKT